METHYKSMKLALDLIEAAQQSAQQYMSTRQALIKARKDEESAKQKEKTRQEKQEKLQKEREAKAKVAAEKREERKKQQEEQKREQAKKDNTGEGDGGCENGADGEGEGGDAGDESATKKNQGSSNRRRGRGGNEMGSDDLPVLANRFQDHDIPTFGELKGFVKQNMAIQMGTELKQFISDFAQNCNDDPDKVKSTHPLSEPLQDTRNSLSFEHEACAALELQAQLEQKGEPTEDLNCASCVLERDVFLDEFDEVSKAIQIRAANGEMAKKTIEQERLLRGKAQLVAHQHGKTFTGVISGLFPHVIYQCEGTKAMAMVSIQDVPQY